MMPATIARAASAGDAFSAVSASPILVSIGPGYTPNTCVFCPRSIARVTCVSEWVAAFDALYAARIGKLTNEATELRFAMVPRAPNCGRPRQYRGLPRRHAAVTTRAQVFRLWRGPSRTTAG